MNYQAGDFFKSLAGSLHNRLCGHLVVALEIDSGAAGLRVLFQTMFDMILRAVCNLLLVDTHRAVAVHTANIARCATAACDTGTSFHLRS